MTGDLESGSQESERRHVWLRGLFMLIFLAFFSVGQTVLAAMAVVQFFWLLINKEPNWHLARFGASLAKWLGDVALYLLMDTEEKPFPWAPWPPADNAKSYF